jgi:hypothetical protein
MAFRIPTEWEPWIETYTGKKLDFLDPKPEQIDIEDIATALSNECRFGGHTSNFYSVAEHSVLVATICPPDKQLTGLLHDASEAYLRDIASPIKPHLQNYKVIEEKLMAAISEKFELPMDEWKSAAIKEADIMALKAEARQLLPSQGKDWTHLYQTDNEYVGKLHCFPPKVAKDIFLQAFKQIKGTPVIIEPEERRIIIAR